MVESTMELMDWFRKAVPVITFGYPSFRQLNEKYQFGVCIGGLGELGQAVLTILDVYSYYRKNAFAAFTDPVYCRSWSLRQRQLPNRLLRWCSYLASLAPRLKDIDLKSVCCLVRVPPDGIRPRTLVVPVHGALYHYGLSCGLGGDHDGGPSVDS
jgi:hypothetical protein